MLGNHRAVGSAQVGARCVKVCAGSQAAEEFGHAMHAAGDHGRGEMVWAGDDVGDDFSFGWIWHGRFKNADDGGGARAARVAGIEL